MGLFETLWRWFGGVGSLEEPTADPCKTFPPASQDAISAAETRLGRPLPEALKRVYLEEGNGCIGACYNLLGVEGGATDDLGQNLVTAYEAYRASDPEDPQWNWPEYLLPISHQGCAMYICVDSRDPQAPVIKFDPNAHGEEGWEPCFVPLDMSLEEWLDGGWARSRGQIRQSRSKESPEEA